MAIQDAWKAVYKGWLKNRYYSEPVQFVPIADPTKPRAVVMGIDAERQRESSNTDEDQDERVTVFILRDEDDPDVGGVKELYLNDQIIRAAEFDPNNEPFSHTGEIVERGQHYIRAVFSRYRRVAQGPGGN